MWNGESDSGGGTDAAMAVTRDSLTLGPLLLQAIADPGLLASVDSRLSAPVLRVAAVLKAGQDANVTLGATAETVLWAMWEASGLSERWAERAVGATYGAAEADRGLDAMLALFDAASRFVDRMPAAGAEVFLDHVLGQQFPADSLAPAAPDTDAVSLLTAHAAKGLEWDLVAVAGVNEGVWPDLRLHGSVLGGSALTETLSGLAETPGALVSAQLRSHGGYASPTLGPRPSPTGSLADSGLGSGAVAASGSVVASVAVAGSGSGVGAVSSSAGAVAVAEAARRASRSACAATA